MLQLGDMLKPLFAVLSEEAASGVVQGQRRMADALLATVNHLRPMPQSRRVSDRLAWVYQRRMIPAAMAEGPDRIDRVHLRDAATRERCLCGLLFTEHGSTDIVTGQQRWCYVCIGLATQIIEEEPQ